MGYGIAERDLHSIKEFHSKSEQKHSMYTKCMLHSELDRELSEIWGLPGGREWKPMTWGSWRTISGSDPDMQQSCLIRLYSVGFLAKGHSLP